MKTAELIAVLATDAAPAPPLAVTPRVLLGVLAGAAVALVALLAWLGLRPMGEAMASPSFWMKAGYTVALSTAGLMLAIRLARPGGRLGAAPLIIATAVLTLVLTGAGELARAAPGDMKTVWLGDSWNRCPFWIVALATPIFLAQILAFRRFAPTRLFLAGAAAGLLAGGVGATVYGLYCQETTAAFVVTWYTLGITACAALGGIIGRRLLRW